MAMTASDLIEAASVGLAAQDFELAATRDRQLRSVLRKSSTGSGSIDAAFALERKFRLVFVRCHFAGGAGTAPLVLSLDSAQGSAYDAKLFTISLAGVNKDVNLRISGDDRDDPSPWTFQPGDALRIQWVNPDSGNMTWGLEVGLALAA